jgi:aerobic-type carbon monoxide dehydrogenase small subunit (CoxS/CutS family)
MLQVSGMSTHQGLLVVEGGAFFVLVNGHKMKNCQSMHIVHDK